MTEKELIENGVYAGIKWTLESLYNKKFIKRKNLVVDLEIKSDVTDDDINIELDGSIMTPEQHKRLSK